jgi:hypothetical protein
MSTDVSEVRVASIIRALIMEAARTFEISVDIQLRTRQYIPEDSELHTRRRDNLKSHNIKMDFREICLDGEDWIHFAQDRDQWRALVNTIINFGVHKNWVSSGLAEHTIRFSKRTLLFVCLQFI